MKKRRLAGILMAISVAVSLMAGCGNNAEQTEQKNESSQESGQQQTESDMDFSWSYGTWWLDGDRDVASIYMDGKGNYTAYYASGSVESEGHLEFVDEYGDGNGRYDMIDTSGKVFAGFYLDSDMEFHIGNGDNSMIYIKDVSGYSDPEEDISEYGDPEEDLSAYSDPEEDISQYSDPEEDISQYSDPEEDISEYSDPEEDISEYGDPEEADPEPIAGSTYFGNGEYLIFFTDWRCSVYIDESNETWGTFDWDSMSREGYIEVDGAKRNMYMNTTDQILRLETGQGTGEYLAYEYSQNDPYGRY